MELFLNANIYTMDEKHPKVSAMAVDFGRIVSVGDDDQILAQYKHLVHHEKINDLCGDIVLPGFIDSHIHLQNYALSLLKVDCETGTKTECLDKISERVQSIAPGKWVLGHGWNQTMWSDGYGVVEDLDKVAPNNPVYLTAKSLHAAWCNTEALLIANITSDSDDPEGGVIVRDGGGIPTGILLESAMKLVSEKIPTLSVEEVAEAIGEAQSTLWSMGITGVHDFDRKLCFAALQLLHNQNKLRLRVVKSIPYEDLDSALQLGISTGFGDDFLRIGSVKLFADGALGPRTAAMLRPYEDDGENKGILLLDVENIVEVGQRAIDHGLSLAIHAIGDKANHEVLNALEQLRTYEGRSIGSHTSGKSKSPPDQQSQKCCANLRHRIEHVQLIHPDDLRRLHDLDLIASMQPVHATSDMVMADKYWGKRAKTSYAWRKLLESGALLAFGSDAPVESPNPFWGIHSAVTRKTRASKKLQASWFKENSITIDDAIMAYTIGGAVAGGNEDRVGKLSRGMLADFLILDVNPYEIEADDIWLISPKATYVAGELVFSR